MSLSGEFEGVAKRQDPAVFDFEREVAQVWHDFPQVKDKVIFFDAGAGGKLVYPGSDNDRKQVERLIERYDVIGDFKDFTRDIGKVSSFCSDVGTDERFIFLLQEKHEKYLVDSKAPVAQETAFAFDHELGHSIVPGGLSEEDMNKAECLADAYAVIRHFQRYGADSAAIETIIAGRAFDLVFEEHGYGRDHFTSPVTEQILAQRHDCDWDNMTPAQTVKLAQEFVRKYGMNEKQLDVIDEAFSPLHDKAHSVRSGAVLPLKELAQRVFATDSSSIFKYGAAALELCIDQQAVGALLQGEYWDVVRQRLGERHKVVAQPTSPVFAGTQSAAAYKNAAFKL